MNDKNDVSCRRCGRQLRGRLTAQAGIGAACALREALEAATGPLEPRGGASVTEAVIGLLAAFLYGEPGQVGPLLDAADARGVAALFAAATAEYLAQDVPDGEQRLRRLALAWAQETEAS